MVPTWRVEADYDLTPVNLVYASAARGYKPGGANGSYGQKLIPPVFKPETNTSFEHGLSLRISPAHRILKEIKFAAARLDEWLLASW